MVILNLLVIGYLQTFLIRPPPPLSPLKFWEICKEPSLNLVEYDDEFLGLGRRQNKKNVLHNGKSLPSSTQELHNWLDVCVALSLSRVTPSRSVGWWRNNMCIQQSFLEWLLAMGMIGDMPVSNLPRITFPVPSNSYCVLYQKSLSKLI